MMVLVEGASFEPLEHIGRMAGVSHARGGKNVERATRCIKMGHLGMLEFADATFMISGISRACSHQLVRYREASFNQESQRHVKVDTDTIWYVTPPSCKDLQAYDNFMEDCAGMYESLIQQGVKPEDARFVLPNAAKTQLVMKMNCRELAHFLRQRLAKDAQWEIRELGEAICKALRAESKQWDTLVDLMLEYGE